MKKIWSQILASDRLYLFYFATGLLYFSLYRILFLITYQYRVEIWDFFILLRIFFLGIRFDLSTVAILLVFFVLLSKIRILSKLNSFRFLWIFGPIFILPIVSLHLFADLIYFENANKHIGYEAVVFLGDLPILTKSILNENPLSVSALVLFLGFYIWIIVKISKIKGLQNLKDSNSNLLSQFTRAFVWILFCFLAFRGGIQESPLRASEAIISNDPFLNQLALNGVYTTINDLKSQSIPKHLKMTREEAVAIVKDEIAYPSAEFLGNSEFPILRRTIPNSKSKIKNIVLVIQESWTGKYVWPVGTGIWEGKEITPNYNKLAKKGHSFSKFYANGGRTSNALLSILTSIPDRPGLTAIRTPQVLSQFSALGNVFSKLGYHTSFLTGDDLKFDSLQTILPHFGFQHLIGKQEIFKDGRFSLGAWGFDDEVLFTLAEEEMDLSYRNQKPFLLTILTMTTHYPYKVPDIKFNLFDSQIQDFDYLNTYHYSDWALGEFIKKIEK
ncbi:MAG: sulfatase-like hydrolase/transferase, partial [Leptospira sp.]|nr:sulfatase-like hydrolase/transferase [Leptospira sp.]